MNVKNFLNDTLKDVMSIVKAESGSLFLFDDKTKELILDTNYNSVNLSLQGIKRRVGEGVSGKVVDIRGPVLVKDISNDTRFIRNGFNHYHTNSFISIPLFDSQHLLGVINITDKSTGEPFSEKDLEFAVTLCRYACMVVDNSKQKNILEKYASMGKLAAGIVHEVNNPLDGIMRYTNMLLHQLEADSVAKEYLLEMKKGLSRIALITKSLLEFSHKVNSNFSKNPKYVDLHKLIDESLEGLQNRMTGNITIQKKFNSAIPRVMDIGLSHVITNMIKNALDAMPEGGNLEISTEKYESLVELRFKDSGSGIPSELMETIFEPFFTTKSIDKGAGLGLAMCKEIVNKYEGRIEVQSVQGKGSSFTIVIPKKYLENG